MVFGCSDFGNKDAFWTVPANFPSKYCSTEELHVLPCYFDLAAARATESRRQC